MTVTTTQKLPGKEIIEVLGVVKGSTVRARNVARDIAASFKTVVGGEIHSYTGLMAQAREEAIDRMVEKAKNLGADAIVGMRLGTANVLQGTAEILAYGTAVKFKK